MSTSNLRTTNKTQLDFIRLCTRPFLFRLAVLSEFVLVLFLCCVNSTKWHKGEDHLTTYTFNTHAAKHTFCKKCGVQSFYTPRSNPDGYGVAPHCLDLGTVQSVTVEKFLGDKWEESMKAHKTIKDMSKQKKGSQLEETK